MQIELIIKDLLFTNDCVIVPNFGGFVSNYKAATVKNSPYATFEPPQKQIVFNNNLTIDDGLLTNTISKEYQLSFSEAKQEVENFVTTTKQVLESGNSYTMQGIGSFRKISEEQILFEPGIEENLLSDAFGLDAFEFKVINDPNLLRKETEKIHKRITLRRFAKAALIAMPLAIGAVVLPEKFDSIQLSSLNIFKADKAVEHENAIETVVLNNEAINPIEQKIDELVQKQVALKYVEPEIQKPVDLQYFIVAGSFKNLDNANSLKDQLQSSGFSPDVLQADGYFRVYIDGFEQKDNAENRLLALRKDEKFKSYWIYKK